MSIRGLVSVTMVVSSVIGGCVGPAGPAGPPGANGSDGTNGSNGSNGSNGTNGSDTVPPVSFTSGTRIKARSTTNTTTSADGAQSSTTYFAGWFDSVRNEACAPALAADGKTRCLPQNTAGLAGGNPGYYGDAACTISLAVSYSFECTPTPPTYITQAPAATCPPSNLGPKFFPVGTSYPSYYVKNGATCTGPNAPSSYETFYAVAGSEIDATQFAEMTVTTTTQ